jgi:hypothetical protein
MVSSSAALAGEVSTYQVSAYNVSHASENKIHDDTVAKQFGFVGGLVPGVEVYAYMTHAAVARWGRDWLEAGEIECRFQKPVYDGRIATVTASTTPDGMALRVTSESSECASGHARMLPRQEAPRLADLTFRAPPVPESRPPADEASLAAGTPLCIAPTVIDKAAAAEYLRDVREAQTLYAREGLVHPGQILRLANAALKDNVLLPPWVHVGSRVRNHGLARVGARLEANGVVVANYERKGHRLVDMDVIVAADGATVARILHTAIYRLRPPVPG